MFLLTLLLEDSYYKDRVFLESFFTDLNIVWLVVFIWLSSLTFFLVFLTRRFRAQVKGSRGQNLEKIVQDLLLGQKKDRKDIDLSQKEITVLKEQAREHVQKIALVRYNPFNETGGNQSFSLALLDGKNSGIVISSFHSREGTRLYIKQVAKGQADNSFSQEEKSAIKEAMKK